MKILLPVDGSDYTRRMLEYVAAHPELFPLSCERLALTVVPPLPPQVTRLMDAATLENWQREQAEAVLAPLRAFAAARGWDLQERHVAGQAADAIAAVARSERPDLIVMGSHGHGALGNVILGSVAHGVLARCRTPVLLVR